MSPNPTDDIINKINANLVLLNSVQNKLNNRNNLINDTLLKEQLLLQMENEDLMNQLKKLETIQNTIINRSRMLEENNNFNEEQTINIRILIIGSIITSIFIGILILYGIKIVDFNILKISFIILIILNLIIYRKFWYF